MKPPEQEGIWLNVYPPPTMFDLIQNAFRKEIGDWLDEHSREIIERIAEIHEQAAK
jgi:hypothetical protein